MAIKLRNPDFPASLTDGGWFIPSDYILMKAMFRRDLLRMYTSNMSPGSRVLDFNAGTHGLGPDLITAGYEYSALEQNRLVRDVLKKQNLAVEDWRPPHIPQPDNSCDLVLSLAFFEHLPTWIDAMQQLLEVKKALKPDGRFLIIAPNAPGMGTTFWDDYKQGWIVSRKRLIDMAEEAGFEVVSTRYSIGWITLKGGPIWSTGRVIARMTNALLNLPVISRLLETIGLDNFSAKVKKTIFELIAVEIRKPHGTD